MAVSLVVGLCFIFVAGVTGSRFTCPGPGYYPDPESCTAFYRCVNHSTSYRYTCPLGTRYDPRVSNCNHAFLVPICITQISTDTSAIFVPPQYPTSPQYPASPQHPASTQYPGAFIPQQYPVVSATTTVRPTTALSSGVTSTTIAVTPETGAASSAEVTGGGGQSLGQVPASSGEDPHEAPASEPSGAPAGPSEILSSTASQPITDLNLPGSGQAAVTRPGSAVGTTASPAATSADSAASTSAPAATSADLAATTAAPAATSADSVATTSASAAATTATPVFSLSPNSIYPCERPGYYREPANCRQFYTCKEVAPGVLSAERIFQCPDRYLFDPATRLCQRAEKVRCPATAQFYNYLGPLLVQLEENQLEQFFSRPLTYQGISTRTSEIKEEILDQPQQLFYPSAVSNKLLQPAAVSHKLPQLLYPAASPHKLPQPINLVFPKPFQYLF